MYEQLKQNLDTFFPMTPEEFIQFALLLTPRTLKKHQFLLKAGEVCSDIVFINRGCLRYYYLRDGNEHIGQFFFEGAWVGEYYSFLTRQPSRQYIDALEDCELLTMRYDSLQKLYQDNVRFERFGRLIAERVVIGSQQRTASLLLDSPEERYLTLIRERPKVAERVALHHIAAYLGITPESLSRIRKRIADNR